MKTGFYLVLMAFVALTGCSKSGGNDPGPNCAAVSSITLHPSATTLAKGQTLNFNATGFSDVTYHWKFPNSSTIMIGATGSISPVDFIHEGWYVLTATNGCGQSKKDSFYLDVTMPQEAATCNPTNNQISFTAANHQTGTFTNISVGENPSIPNIYTLEAYGTTPGSSSITINFHPWHKNNNQPQPGVYTTGTYSPTGYPAFGSIDYDKIYVAVITYSPATIVYKAAPGQKVYITRVGGKLKATICDIPMTGSSNGTPYTTNMTLAVTEP